MRYTGLELGRGLDWRWNQLVVFILSHETGRDHTESEQDWKEKALRTESPGTANMQTEQSRGSEQARKRTLQPNAIMLPWLRITKEITENTQ